MFQSLRLGRFAGVDLFVHSTFWILPLIVLFSGVSAGATSLEIGIDIAFVAAVFGCIMLHELGHALAARAYGIGTRDITLYHIGGVASLERMPEKPGQEIAIALAGPAVNFIIAAGLFAGLFASTVLIPWTATADASVAELFAAKVKWANIVLGAFNLLPCFPMDGGRVLRALLATRLNRVRATEIATGVGTVVAGAFLVAGLYLPQYSLVLLAGVVWLLGQAELAGVRAQAAAREARDRFTSWFEPEPGSSGPTGNAFTGLVWDETHRVWIQYQDGRIVRVIHPEN